MNKIPLIAVCGPTASGKTSLAVRLAIEFDGEVVSCDSMQIYKNMNIGTAKPTADEMMGVPHHMIDVCDPSENFNVSDYVSGAKKAIDDIFSRGKTVIICGGTGMYLDTLLRGTPCAPDVPDGIRETLEVKSSEELWNELFAADPESALATHRNNRKRVIRALEIFLGTGKTKTYWDALSRKNESKYDCLMLGLDYKDRNVLYDRIDRRVDIMFDAGIVEEVRGIGLDPNTTAGQAIGYKEIFDLLDGTITAETARDRIKQATRRYAKRQLTWFRREENIHWFYPDDTPNFYDSVAALIKQERK